ncbi:Lactoylglutathione lyase [Linum perenne]
MAESAAVASPSADLLEFLKKDKRRLLHAVYRVGDLDRTIQFYTEGLGMKLLRKRDIPEEKYSNAFLGFGPEVSNFELIQRGPTPEPLCQVMLRVGDLDRSIKFYEKLTYNYGVTEYSKGNAYAQIAVGTDDVYKSAEEVGGGKITREPGPIPGLNTKITAFLDPDGWKTVS